MSASAGHPDGRRERTAANRRLALLLGTVALAFFAATMLLGGN